MFSLSASIAACASTWLFWPLKHQANHDRKNQQTATGCLLQLGFSQSPPLILQCKTSLSPNPILKLQKWHRLQIACWHIFIPRLLKSRTIINSLCKAFCLVTRRRIARHKMANIYIYILCMLSLETLDLPNWSESIKNCTFEWCQCQLKQNQ